MCRSSTRQQTCRCLMPRLRAAAGCVRAAPNRDHGFPPLLDAEGGFGLAPIERPDEYADRRRRAAPRPGRSHGDPIAAARRCGIAADRCRWRSTTETITTALGIEPEQLLAIGVRLDAPDFRIRPPSIRTWYIGGLRVVFCAFPVFLERIPLARTSSGFPLVQCRLSKVYLYHERPNVPLKRDSSVHYQLNLTDYASQRVSSRAWRSCVQTTTVNGRAVLPPPHRL